MITPSKKQINILNLAYNVANQSNVGRFRHGAVLVSHGKIINVSSNDNRFCDFGTKFRSQPGKATLHAELGAILNVSNKSTKNSVIYVVRVSTNGELRNSKPCSMCEAAMKFVGISRVIYSVDGGYEEMKL